ncbi:hypothetical protein MGWOODY_XGa2768 [hydrothermal vent metagenome]|uniref:Uncharacterized protein n=1 Tax=hydrothermal vent metagenome TaxID=652676 RepID=A0A170PRL4_9ZZZZ
MREIGSGRPIINLLRPSTWAMNWTRFSKDIDTRSTQIETVLGHGSAPQHHDLEGSEIQPSVDL